MFQRNEFPLSLSLSLFLASCFLGLSSVIRACIGHFSIKSLAFPLHLNRPSAGKKRKFLFLGFSQVANY